MRGKKYVISIIVAAAALIGFIVAICFVFFAPRELNDYYFVDSDSRIVSSMDSPSSTLYYGAKKVHRVYEVSGKKVNSYKLYYVYEDAGAASAKFDEVRRKSLESLDIEKAEQEGKYIIVTMKEKMYKDVDADSIRKMIRRLEGDTHSEEGHELERGDETEPQEEYWEDNE